MGHSLIHPSVPLVRETAVWGGLPGWASARGSVHTSLTTAQERPWPHFTDQEAETWRSESSLFAPSCPGTQGSLSEAGIRLRQLWWALLGSAPPLFPGWQMEGCKQGLPAQALALRPLTPHPYSSPTPPGTELQETLSGSSHCSRGPLKLHYCPRASRKSLLSSSCYPPLPSSPSSRGEGQGTQKLTLPLVTRIPGAPHQEMPPQTNPRDPSEMYNRL